MSFFIRSVVGQGGSCLVYDGYYENNAGGKSTVRIKECYPYMLSMERNSQGGLMITQKSQRKQFELYKKRFRDSFVVISELHEMAGLTNYTSQVYDLYEKNGTLYTVSSYVEGNTLDKIQFSSIREVLRVVMSTAKCIQQIHERGYLYLDVKPENIRMYATTPEMVELFDFDTVIPQGMKEGLSNYRVACSRGYAPLEQKMGDMSQIGTYTDIYAVGALLFSLIFGRTPRAVDCGDEASYDYTKLKWNVLYHPGLYRELTVFFHKTLQAGTKDRYPDMRQVLEQLERIERFGAEETVISCSRPAVVPEKMVGRQKECDSLFHWWQGEDPITFVTGMGGIGKSTVVSKFVQDNKNCFDQVIYLSWKESLEQTLTDDRNFGITGYKKEGGEETAEYFIRKMKAVRRLAEKERFLLILDNFEGNITEGFAELLKVNWKVILVTRRNMELSGYPVQKILPLQKTDEIYRLFENNLGRRLKTDETAIVTKLADKVERHTLLLSLIARQVAKSYLSMKQAWDLAEAYGVSQMASEKVDYLQNGVEGYDKISRIIKVLYDASGLSDEKKRCLKFFSLFDAPGISVGESRGVLQLGSLDAVNELHEEGWIRIQGERVQMHPLIHESIQQMEWSEKDRECAKRQMEILCQQIQWEFGTWERERTIFDGQKSGVLETAKSVLKYGGEDSRLAESKCCKQLQILTLLYLPKEDEKYILAKAAPLLRERGKENPRQWMELQDYVVYLLCQRKEYEKAAVCMKEAEKYASESGDLYIWGRYYDMKAGLYDEMLNGAYDDTGKKKQCLIHKMLRAVDKSINCMKRAGGKEAERLVVKYTYGKIFLLIRCMPERDLKIKRLIIEMEKVLKRDESYRMEFQFLHYMARAWYFTLCREKAEQVLYNLKKAGKCSILDGRSDLDQVDYWIIPGANMLFELGEGDQAEEWLTKGKALCEAHPEELPFMRKKDEIEQHLREVKKYF